MQLSVKRCSSVDRGFQEGISSVEVKEKVTIIRKHVFPYLLSDRKSLALKEEIVLSPHCFEDMLFATQNTVLGSGLPSCSSGV